MLHRLPPPGAAARRAGRRSPLLRAGAALAAAVTLALALPRPADAHTRLESSTPAAGETVTGSPSELRLRFSRPVSAGLTSVALVRGADTLATIPGAPVDGSEGREFTFAIGRALEAGAYTVAWRTAGADGHVIRGTFSFTVARFAAGGAPADTGRHVVGGAPADTGAASVLDSAAAGLASIDPPAEEAETSSDAAAPLPVLVRWGWFLSLLGAIGAVAFRFLVLRPLARAPEHAAVAERAAYGAWLLALGAAALSALTLLARLWIQAASLGGEEAFEGAMLRMLLTGTGWGVAWVLQAMATVAFFVGLAVARAPHGRSAGWMGAAAAALLLAAVPALSGHAASVESLTGLAIAADVAHVLGGGIWLGTLAVILAAGLPAALTAPDGEGPRAVATMVHAFSPVALVGAGVAAATGVAAALVHTAAVSDLWTTGYGRMILLKVALLGIVAALGFFNWRVIRPALGTDAATGRLRRSARAEVAMGVAVVLVTAILVALPTP